MQGSRGADRPGQGGQGDADSVTWKVCRKQLRCSELVKCHNRVPKSDQVLPASVSLDGMVSAWLSGHMKKAFECALVS